MYRNTLLNNLFSSIYNYKEMKEFTENTGNPIFPMFLTSIIKEQVKTLYHLKKFNLFGKNTLPLVKLGKNTLPNKLIGKYMESKVKYGKNNMLNKIVSDDKKLVRWE